MVLPGLLIHTSLRQGIVEHADPGDPWRSLLRSPHYIRAELLPSNLIFIEASIFISQSKMQLTAIFAVFAVAAAIKVPVDWNDPNAPTEVTPAGPPNKGNGGQPVYTNAPGNYDVHENPEK